MRLSIQFKPNKRIDIEFGYKTPLFRGMHWFSIIICDLNKFGEVEYASLIITWFLHPKYWFNRWRKKQRDNYYIMNTLGSPDDCLLSDCPDCGFLNGEHAIGCPYLKET